MNQTQEQQKIDWKGIEYSRDDFYRMHNISKDLLELLSDFHKIQENGKERVAALAVEISYALARYAREVSDDAFVEAFQASVALQAYFVSKGEMDQSRAKYHLDNVRKELCLDDLFSRQ